jgi:facilitated trehalose transporter
VFHKFNFPIESTICNSHNSFYLLFFLSLATRQVYISEISSPDIRGFLSAIQKVSGHLGVLISYLLGAYLDWRQLAMLVSVAPMMLFVTVIYIPETPSFLVLKGRDEDAYR